PRLFDTFFGCPTADGMKGGQLAEGHWHRLASGMLLLAVNPPAKAREGVVNVHVRQESSGREAVVEFTLDASARGPGCYKV
ncbi:MAG TPA: hypothetical protein VH092_23070, partial [Urbifossiella sp.]|nr:hypothetical protein [Urbifossiella sp.]